MCEGGRVYNLGHVWRVEAELGSEAVLDGGVVAVAGASHSHLLYLLTNYSSMIGDKRKEAPSPHSSDSGSPTPVSGSVGAVQGDGVMDLNSPGTDSNPPFSGGKH